MNLKRLTIVGLVGAGLLLAQPGGRGQRGPWGPRPDALKELLSLSDAQLQQIREITKKQMEDLKPIGEQMREKGQALRDEMKKETPDQARVGQLTVDLKGLREQLKSKRAARGDSISAVLTPEQREKLNKLKEAAKLGPAVRQAAALGLIDPELTPGQEQWIGAAMRMRAERAEGARERYRGSRKQ
jgi:Spy/CpxP family protein refolding chaperone